MVGMEYAASKWGHAVVRSKQAGAAGGKGNGVGGAVGWMAKG